MSDDQVVRLLEEIRAPQKENAANYRVALQNQQEAKARQKRGIKGIQRSKAGFVGLFVYLSGRPYHASLLSWFFQWTLRH